jgi:hypothetical protein
MTDAEKVEAIREVLAELEEYDPEFWTLDQLDTALNKISDIVDPPEEAP